MPSPDAADPLQRWVLTIAMRRGPERTLETCYSWRVNHNRDDSGDDADHPLRTVGGGVCYRVDVWTAIQWIAERALWHQQRA